ncbi:MAG: hypothetical protein KJ559_02595 [Nanoarchaeota archaeon]|nr:hypothetical protein [Nanoarchaeota archaeon]
MGNKRGQEGGMTIGTLVVIVLSIIVLVVLALGFGTGWTNLWSKISGYMSPVNVDDVRQACSIACMAGEEYNFCFLKRDVIIMKDEKKNINDYKDLTCDQLFKRKTLGFEKCDKLDCPTGGEGVNF